MLTRKSTSERERSGSRSQFSQTYDVPNGTVGIHVGSVEGAREYTVALLRGPSGRDPKTPKREHFKPLETFMLKLGDRASRPLSDAGAVRLRTTRRVRIPSARQPRKPAKQLRGMR
jgi:hypothetical protein